MSKCEHGWVFPYGDPLRMREAILRRLPLGGYAIEGERGRWGKSNVAFSPEEVRRRFEWEILIAERRAADLRQRLLDFLKTGVDKSASL